MPMQRVTLRPRNGMKMHVKKRVQCEKFHDGRIFFVKVR